MDMDKTKARIVEGLIEEEEHAQKERQNKKAQGFGGGMGGLMGAFNR